MRPKLDFSPMTIQGRNHVVKLLLAKSAQNRPQSPWWRLMASTLWGILKERLKAAPGWQRPFL
jgi:hypothetical protein